MLIFTHHRSLNFTGNVRIFAKVEKIMFLSTFENIGYISKISDIYQNIGYFDIYININDIFNPDYYRLRQLQFGNDEMS